MSSNFIVRFAPSPTGMLHIGSARTALFNYLFAKKIGAKFILRVEDTDKARSTQESVNAILNGMKILGINYDEIIFQSSRIERHKEVAYKLVESGYAFYHEDPEKGKAIKIKIPKNEKIIFNDLIRGEIEFDSRDIEEFVLLRSDGTPTYMLAVAVDDIDMKITHIIRGDDHIGNTPKQILIYKALGAKIPDFAHIPLIHDIEGNKLSKRKGAASVEEYLKLGYLPEAIFNYLLHLGGGFTKDIISRDEAIEGFNISKVGKSPSRFDFDKLNFLNLHYIQKMNDDEFLKVILENISQKGLKISKDDIESIKRLVLELKKCNLLTKSTETALLVTENFDFEQDKTEELETNEENKKILKFFKENYQDFDFINLKDSIKNAIENFKLDQKSIYHVLRFMLIGKVNSISINNLIFSLGTETVKKRIKNFFLSKEYKNV